MRKQLDIYSFTVIFYIAMTLIANDLLIPSRLCTIAIGLLVLGTALHLIQKDKFILKKNKYNFFCWYLLFVGISVVAMLYSPDKSILNDSSYLLYTTAIILFCFCTLVDSYEKIIMVMKSYEWGSAILFAILFFTNNLISDERLGSNFAGNSNTFALFMMVAFFFTSWQFLYYEKDRLKKGIAGIIMIMNIVTVLLSGARKIIVACMIYVIILYLSKKDKMGRRHTIRNIVIICVAIMLVWQLMMKIPLLYEIVGNRMESLINQFLGKAVMIEGSSSYLRDEYRKLAFSGWLESPIWGHGYDSFHFYNSIVTGHNAYSHNNFTELLYNVGIIGFITYYFEYYRIVKLSIKSKVLPVKVLTIAGIVGVLVSEYGQVDYNLSIIAIFLFVLYKLNIFVRDNKLILFKWEKE